MLNDGFFKILDTVDSTNNYAMALIKTGVAKHGMAIFAKDQTAGKGQRGKSWQTQPGQNIALSLILGTNTLRTDQQFCLSMCIALAVNDFVKEHIKKDIAIKWPNDLYWRDRKAGGILIETVFKGTDWQWAVAGIGININQTQFGPLIPNATSLQLITGKIYDVIELAKQLHGFVIKRTNSLSNTTVDDIVKEYNKNLYKLNQQVRLKKENAVFKTTIKGVSQLGQLHTSDSMDRQFDFGEVEWVL
jgi:BirA family transcriptional regulator, biotin operon repressor / biotin---[acetyl-CoA-carboxylase] ligase